MNVEYTGLRVPVPESARRLADRKLAKLARVLPRATHARVRLAADGYRQRAEVTLHSPHLDLTAVETGASLAATLRAAITKLEQQARRAAARRREAKRRAAAPKTVRAKRRGRG
jgi:ribosomal subunit interface protein